MSVTVTTFEDPGEKRTTFEKTAEDSPAAIIPASIRSSDDLYCP